MIRSAWCKAKLACIERRPVGWAWGPAVRSQAEVARKKAAFIRAALMSRSFDWACGAVGWRPNTARDHGFYDQEFSAVYELALAGKTNHPRVTQYLAELEQTALRIEQMIADAPRRRAEREAEQDRKREERAAQRAAAEAEWQAKLEADRERRRQEAAEKAAELEAAVAKRAHRQAQREVAARNREEFARVRAERKAARIAAGQLAKQERARKAAAKQPRPLERTRASQTQREAPPTTSTSGETAPQRPTAPQALPVAVPAVLTLPCGCSATDHCAVGAQLEARARRLTAREIAEALWIRGFDEVLHERGREARVAYLRHRRELEHPAILAAALAGDWRTEPATDGVTHRDQMVRTGVEKCEILEAAA